MPQFRWIEWNIEHIAGHGVSPKEAEWVVTHPARGYPTRSHGAYTARGQTRAGRYIQVVYKIDEGDVFVFHSRPLNEREKRRSR